MLAEDVGRRLENFFWRIWGNERLCKTITGTLIAAIFNKISEGGYIRTTPTQSPRASRSLGAFDQPRQPEELKASIPPTLHPTAAGGRGTHDGEKFSDAEETETESPLSRRKRLPPRPPPILKKTKEPSPPVAHLSASKSYSITSLHQGAPSQESRVINPTDRSSKTTRFQMSDISSSIPRHSTGTGVAVHEESIDSRGKTKQKPVRRKVAVVASTVTNKRRPAIKSRGSQSSSTGAPITTPVSSRSESVVGAQAEQSSSAGYHGRTGKTIISPVRVQHILESETSRNYDPTEKPDPDQVSNRDQSVVAGSRPTPNTRTTPSFSSLTSFIQKSTAAAAASASYQASGTMDLGQQFSSSKNVSFAMDSVDDGSLPHLPGHAPLPEVTSTMPKTKSQLTLLLQRDQKPNNDG